MEKRRGCLAFALLCPVLLGFGLWRGTRPTFLHFDFLQGHRPLNVQSVAPLSSSRLGVSFLVVRTFALPTEDRFYLRAARELKSRGYAFQASGDGPTPLSEFAAGNAGVQIEPGKPKPPRIIDDESYFRTEPDPEWVMVTVWEEDRRPEWAIIAERTMKWVGRGFR